MQDVSPEELVEALPAHNPRYVAYSYCYKHDDGRTSYPLIFIYFSPLGKPKRNMDAVKRHFYARVLFVYKLCE